MIQWSRVLKCIFHFRAASIRKFIIVFLFWFIVFWYNLWGHFHVGNGQLLGLEGFPSYDISCTMSFWHSTRKISKNLKRWKAQSSVHATHTHTHIQAKHSNTTSSITRTHTRERASTNTYTHMSRRKILGMVFYCTWYRRVRVAPFHSFGESERERVSMIQKLSNMKRPHYVLDSISFSLSRVFRGVSLCGSPFVQVLPSVHRHHQPNHRRSIRASVIYYLHDSFELFGRMACIRAIDFSSMCDSFSFRAHFSFTMREDYEVTEREWAAQIWRVGGGRDVWEGERERERGNEKRVYEFMLDRYPAIGTAT